MAHIARYHCLGGGDVHRHLQQSGQPEARSEQGVGQHRRAASAGRHPRAFAQHGGGKLPVVTGEDDPVGTQNRLLNQFTAAATGIPVITGPIAATVLGNAAVQLIALRDLSNVAQARQMIADMGAGGKVIVVDAQSPQTTWAAATREARAIATSTPQH